ncbi:MAG: hypothetical protein DRP63_00525 [Planctomycetota bacterium]|nr:MAG: hypothetical protein DRP63_00525 [Planctomycetota bacterium]
MLLKDGGEYVTLQGDLRDINLADIFQTLAANQQEGTLTIRSGKRRMDIYFSKEGVRLLTTGEEEYPRLGEILLREKKITPVELDMALARQKMTGEMLGQALVDMGIVTEEEIEKAVRHQIEEEIFDVFSWKDAKFEFVPGEPRGEFFDPAKLGKPITFNVESVIMEAARRIDEWQMIHSIVPTMQVIFRVRDPYAEPPDIAEKAGTTEEAVAAIVELVDGRRTVEQIVEESRRSKFEVCKVLALLAQAHYLEPLSVKEMVVVADQYANEGDLQTAIKIYKSLLANLPPTSVLRNRLAELYEKAGSAQEAAMEYAALADALLQEGADEDAFALYKKALELAPRNFTLHQKLFEFYLAKKNKEGAVQEGLFVARGFWRMNRLQEAKDVLERLLPLASENIEMRQMLINICLDLGQNEEAIKQYEYLAGYYKERGATEEMIQIYRKILAIDKERSDIRAELEKLLSKGEKKRGSAAVWIGVVVAVVVGVGAFFFWRYNSAAQATFDSLSDRISSLMSEDALERYSMEERRSIVDDIRKKVNEAARKYRFAFFVSPEEKVRLLQDALKSLVALKERVDRRQRSRLAREREQVAKRLAEARRCYDECRLNDAVAILQDVIERSSKEPGAVPASYVRQAKELLSKALWEMRQAKILHNEAVIDERNGDIRSAFLKMKTLLARCPRSEEAQKVLLPLEVETEPAGAEVVVNGKVRKSPTVIHRRPNVDIRILVRKRGYKEEEFVISDDRWHLKVMLERVPVWTTDLTDVIKGEEFIAPPLAVGDKIYAFSEGCKIVCIRSTNGKVVWSYDTKGEGFFGTNAAYCDGKLVVVEQRQTGFYAHVIDTKARKLVGQPLRFSQRVVPRVAAERVYLRGDDVLVCLTKDLTDVEWTFTVESRITAGPVFEARHNYVIIATEEGKVLAFEAGTKKVAWQSELMEESPCNALCVRGNTVIALCRDAVVRALYTWKEPPSTAPSKTVSRLAWEARVSNEPVAESPVFHGDFLYFVDTRGVLHAFSLKKRSEVWVTAKPVLTTFMWPPVAWGKDAVAVVGDGGIVTVINASNGKELWRFTRERVMTQPVVWRDLLILFTTDGSKRRVLSLVR